MSSGECPTLKPGIIASAHEAFVTTDESRRHGNVMAGLQHRLFGLLDRTIAATARRLAGDKRALMVVTADHAQPQTIIGVALTGALVGRRRHRQSSTGATKVPRQRASPQRHG